MKSKATFNIDGGFKLTGRGLVIYGDIVDGVINNENFISFNSGQKEIKLKIKSIEFLDNTKEKVSKVGLTFYYDNDNDNDRESLERVQVPKQIAIVTSE